MRLLSMALSGPRGMRTGFILAAVFSLFAVPCASQSKPTEYDVKAAYLFNFGKFVQWSSANPSRSFDICIIGADPFGGRLDTLVAGEQLEGKPVAIKHTVARNAANCRVVFLGASEESRSRAVLATLARWGVLTVSDMPDFLDHGGMIQFVLDGDRVRFEVNLDPAETAGLSLSSQLLKVASVVVRKPAGGGGGK